MTKKTFISELANRTGITNDRQLLSMIFLKVISFLIKRITKRLSLKSVKSSALTK